MKKIITEELSLSTGVSLAMRLEITAQLAKLEQDLKIRVLFAAESGSRAWGFASPNSDYDVRFVYVPAPEWYFSVSPKRDVIERMLPGDIDLSGWELRKSLRLFKRYNAALNEWLDSPIQYASSGATSDQLRQLLPLIFKPAAALHHYASMADTALQGMPLDSPVSAKKLCYLLRALFACRHVLALRTQPPTMFQTMLSAWAKSPAERTAIAQILQAKALASEQAFTELSPAMRQSYSDEIKVALAARATIGGGQRVPASVLDDILRTAVMYY